jgi:hypothetical protein
MQHLSVRLQDVARCRPLASLGQLGESHQLWDRKPTMARVFTADRKLQLMSFWNTFCRSYKLASLEPANFLTLNSLFNFPLQVK